MNKVQYTNTFFLLFYGKAIVLDIYHDMFLDMYYRNTMVLIVIILGSLVISLFSMLV